MKKYNIISWTAFLIMFIGIKIAIMVFGADSIVPVGWQILIFAILANSLLNLALNTIALLKKIRNIQ